ncbi:translation elongation factor Ts [Serinibacter salmoneus]|uniref:Elongation factor Ts n=1 Tax=Serinibacter salmoneus TaxID=556530 RepID=A0A2A9D0F0_9MICO|nr:translation elongation factor Ts [Serinibacter salmoneus]PFG19320.1 translation elongation factor Ts (EF-Ts) [Serinibacter salmoneus]
MATYTAADIKALREKSGAGMLDVKKALDEAQGDADKAMEIIRIKGLKGVAKREDRQASEGLVVAAVVDAPDADGQIGILVELNAETDFVAKNEKFIELADTVLGAAVASGAADADALLTATVGERTVSELVDESAATLGEKIVVRRVARLGGERIATYLHRTSKDLPPQVGVLVASDVPGAEIAGEVAMHVAAFSPLYLQREEIPEATVADERRIAEETARNEGKPEAALPKIIEGRLNGFFKDQVLLDQAFAREPKKSVGTVVSEAGGTITGFVRYRVGA